MAAEYPPLLNSYGNVQSMLAKIQATPIPERFTHEFLSGTLGFRRDGDRPFVPLARRMGLLEADGRPTDLYRRFHDATQSKAALAEATRNAFSQLYAQRDDVDTLDKKALLALVAAITGLAPAHPSARAVVGTFLALKTFVSTGSPQMATDAKPGSRKSTWTAREIRAEYFGLTLMLQK